MAAITLVSIQLATAASAGGGAGLTGILVPGICAPAPRRRGPRRGPGASFCLATPHLPPAPEEPNPRTPGPGVRARAPRAETEPPKPSRRRRRRRHLIPMRLVLRVHAWCPSMEPGRRPSADAGSAAAAAERLPQEQHCLRHRQIPRQDDFPGEPRVNRSLAHPQRALLPGGACLRARERAPPCRARARVCVCVCVCVCGASTVPLVQSCGGGPRGREWQEWRTARRNRCGKPRHVAAPPGAGATLASGRRSPSAAASGCPFAFCAGTRPEAKISRSANARVSPPPPPAGLHRVRGCSGLLCNSAPLA